MDFIEYVTKGAEAAGTNLMPTNVGPAAAARPSATKTIPKTGADLRRVDSLVDTTGKEAPRVLYSKTAERYALPSFALYPLDNYAQVKMASAYFEEHAGAFDLKQRREFALNLVARAEELGIKVATRAQCYVSQLPASLTDLT